MNSNPSQKRLQNEDIDRISDLPDLILGKILSYLPTQMAVATSILSSRWKTIFPFAVPFIRLDLDDSYMFYNSSPKFMDFVEKLLNVALLDVTCVERVVFNCENDYGDDKIVSWVCAALRLNVEHLRLMSYLHDSEALFNSLNGCTTLVELELGNGFELSLPEGFILPNLKRLSLNSLILGDDKYSFHEFISGCPVLNYLRIIGCCMGDLNTLYIQHPFINKLYIDDSFIEERCRVVIDAPNLEAFAFEGHSVAKYVLRNMQSLHSVCIDYNHLSEEIDGDRLCSNSRRLDKLVKACSRITCLRLPEKSVMGLCFSSCVSLPTFQNLTCLALGCMRTHGWGILAHFLENAPNLTLLTFEEGLEFIGCDAKFMLPGMPVCWELRIKKIEIWEWNWTSDEIDFIEYFLKNGRTLEELIVCCLPCKKQSDLEKLSMLPRHSKACQVLVKDNNRVKFCYSRDNWFQTGHA